MNVAIVEDEKIFMDSLVATLQEWNKSKLDFYLHTFYTGEEIIRRYQAEKIDWDIIFMDMQLGGKDGLEVSAALRKLGYENAIVFTTSHTEFDIVQKSFDISALRYFVKPITLDKVRTCMELIPANTQFIYQYNKEQIILPYKDIVFFQSDRNYTIVRTVNDNNKEQRFRSKLTSLIDELPKPFVQCARSYVVNLKHILMIEGRNLHMRTTPNTIIPIGESYLNDLLTAYRQL